MKITVKNYEKKYEFNLKTVAQLCGQNMQKKAFIFESLSKYFSNYKYSEAKNPWRDNVLVDEEQVGRKFFKTILVENKNDLISCINLSKQSFLFSYIKYILQDFDCRFELELIENSLEKIFLDLNDRVSKVGNIRLKFREADVWDMVQKTDIMTNSDEDIGDSSNFELLLTLFNLIEHLEEIEPDNYLFLFPNIDHIVTREEYRRIYDRMDNLARNFNLKFICALSLDGYIKITRENIEEVSVFNDEDFEMPDIDHLTKFLEDNYPIYKEYDGEEVIGIIEGIIQRIGKRGYLVGVEDNVVTKLINSSMQLKETVECENNPILGAFLSK